MSRFSPSTSLLFQPQAKCLGWESSEGALSAGVGPVLPLEEVGASEGWVTPCSMLLSLDVLGGVGGKDTVLI